MTIVSETSGDIWIHRDGEKVWWTISNSERPTFERKTEPVGFKRDVIVCHRPCAEWSDRSRTGQELYWRSLHPKAKDFLSTEATLQELSEDYAGYAIALIDGADRHCQEFRVWAGIMGSKEIAHGPPQRTQHSRRVARPASVGRRSEDRF
ncbi:MAG TPA: hypothetical protein ENH55_23490 [Aurantimonas coralicida]|nr:hypothetical protein [Aurantimonas coralicida]